MITRPSSYATAHCTLLVMPLQYIDATESISAEDTRARSSANIYKHKPCLSTRGKQLTSQSMPPQMLLIIIGLWATRTMEFAV